MRAMKDSGIPWIGEIPENWEVKRLKQESIFINGFAFDSEDFKIDEGVRVIRIGDIGLKADFENCVRAITNSSILKPYRIEDGDILIAMSGATTGKCCIVDKSEEAYINQRVGIIRSDIRKIIYYSLQTPYFMEFVNLNNAGSAQPNISSKAIGEFPILSIPTTEQQRIAEFLDRKCAEVDEMIALQEQIIEELKAYKQSVITEAVTKGLNPDVPMRDSGIEWIGSIPEHWKLLRIKNILKEVHAITPTGEGEKLSVTQNRGIIKTAEIEVANPSLSTIGWKVVYENDIVFNKYKAHSGVFFVSPYNGIVTFNYSVYRCYDDYMPKFYEYVFKTVGCISEFRKEMRGVGESISPLYTKDLLSINIYAPPKFEQESIIKYLNIKCTEIDSLIQTKQSKIDSLKEYKKSIIYEYVTGKREVNE